MNLLTYKLSNENIYQKVGNNCDLTYPNNTFIYLIKLILCVLSAFLLFILLFQTYLHMAIFLIHLEIVLVILICLYFVQIGKDWINTVLVCIDTIFVIEEVLRRKKGDYDEINDLSMRRRNHETNSVVNHVVSDNIVDKQNSYLKVDMKKLNAALSGTNRKLF